MSATPSPEHRVDLDSWDLGDVIAIVDTPDAFAKEDRSSTTTDVVNATVSAATGGLGNVVVPLVLLMLKGRRTESAPPHAALMAVEDARRLAQRELLFFPEGGPSIGHVYARHPLRRRDYVPYAGFHRLVLNEKSIEAARYLLSLGARDVEIAWREAIGSTAKAEGGGVGLPTAADVSLTMGFGRDDTGKLAIRITGAGKTRPQVPDLIWPARDPMFRLIRTTADAGAETFHFGIRTEQSASVNAAAAVKLMDVGFNLGGEYKRWEDLAFTVDASFAPGQ